MGSKALSAASASDGVVAVVNIFFAAMKALGDVSLLNGATLYVIRVGKHGDLLGSKPCCECEVHLLSAMRKYGLKQVFYS